ncbi:MAG: DUF1990 domain-containing protein [Acidobacteriota bacterium]|nr:DUF1990 domain-containing protein [Acidobacteriota bacterium]
MFLPTRPNKKIIQQFLDARRDDNFSYPEIGASHIAAPDGYNVDHNRIQIGNGFEDFNKAIEAVKNWKMFEMSWVELCWTNTPIKVGENVAALIKHFGFWSLNASRIVYVIEEKGEIEKYGFAYGTLTEHGEQGEERFTVEFHRANDEVWYDLYAFSKPKHILATIGYPISRLLQRQFAVESKKSMCRAVRGK